MKAHRFLRVLAASILVLALDGLVFADTYPARMITFVVGFPAGGGTDLAARIIGKKLEERLGKPVVIENKSGAAGQLALSSVSRSPPDGYQLALGSSATMAMAYGLHKEKLPYDPNADFVPIAQVADVPFVLVVNPKIPAANVAELVAYVRSQKDPVTIATAGPGSTHHLYGELLNELTGMKLSPVPYRGSLPAVTDVVAGHVPLMFVDLPACLSLIREGKLRALGVSTKARLAAAPEIPSLSESGVPDFDAASWFVMLAPRDTPSDVTSKLHEQFKEIMEMPDVRRAILDMGMVPVVTTSTDDLRKYIRGEVSRWTGLIDRLGIRPEQ
jgi:tripartite-type tricarboxylate transporter receptor subunit TctC